MLRFVPFIAKRNGSDYHISSVLGNLVACQHRDVDYCLDVSSGVIFRRTGEVDAIITTASKVVIKPVRIEEKSQGKIISYDLSASDSLAYRSGLTTLDDYSWSYQHKHYVRTFKAIQMAVSVKRAQQDDRHGPVTNMQDVFPVEFAPVVLAFFEGRDADQITKGINSQYGYQIGKLIKNYLSGGYNLPSTLEDILLSIKNYCEGK